MVKGEVLGDTPINRPEASGRKRRLMKKLTEKSSWFRKKSKTPEDQAAPQPFEDPNLWKKRRKPRSTGAIESILFIPHTPNSILKRRMQDVEDKMTGKEKFGRVRMIETLGQKLNQTLSNNTPWKTQPCGREECGPATTKNDPASKEMSPTV